MSLIGRPAQTDGPRGEEGWRIETLRVSILRERSPLSYALAAPIDAARTGRELVSEDLDREVCGILLVNTRNRVTAMHIVSVGTLNGAYVHPREVFKAAILGTAAAIILFHNHPSGDPDASREDRELTRRLTDAGRILGIDVLDDVILGESGSYYSFKERGLI